MPVDPTNFVLGRAGANWDAPTTGWWNTPSMRSAGGSPVTTYTAPRINYGASGLSPAGGMNLTALTSYVNNLNRQAQQAANAVRIPNAPALEQASSEAIASGLAGKVDPSTIRLLRQQAAERGVNVGVDSPNADAAYLQALGITSTNQIAEAQRQLTQAYARNPAAPLFDPTTQLLTPYQSGQLSIQEGQLELAKQSEANRAAEAMLRGGSFGGGGGYRGGGAGAQTPEYAAPTATADTGGDFFQPAGSAQQRWWASIGYGPTTPTATTGSTGSFFAGTPEEYNFREDLASVYPDYAPEIFGGGY